MQVRRGGALLLQALLELGVKGRQFLVEGLKLLLRGFQLLVGRLEFLVYGKGFFVDGPEVFIRNFEIADNGIQLFVRCIEFLLQLENARGVLRGRVCVGSRCSGSGASIKLTRNMSSAGTGRTAIFTP